MIIGWANNLQCELFLDYSFLLLAKENEKEEKAAEGEEEKRADKEILKRIWRENRRMTLWYARLRWSGIALVNSPW